MKKYIKNYFEKLKQGLDEVDLKNIEQVVKTLEEARREEKQVFIFGNGGSATTASHFTNDLNKLASEDSDKKFKAICLSDSIPLMTAWANDTDYENVFVKQLINYLEEGDIVIGISGSGNSQNVLKAFEYANEKDAITIGLLGFDGGKAKDLVDHYVMFREKHYGRVEDAHLIFEHLIANYLRENL